MKIFINMLDLIALSLCAVFFVAGVLIVAYELIRARIIRERRDRED